MNVPVSRENLLKALNITKPALASQSFVPVLTHFLFDGEEISTYNDLAAMSVRWPSDFEACVPGELLIKALNSMTSDKVMLQLLDTGHLLLTSGRSKVKVPTLPMTDFTFTPPETRHESGRFIMSSELLEGIELCLVSVGTDPTHPAQMGVTIENSEQGVLLHSTDNFTLSRYVSKVDEIDLPGEAPVIMPTFFCMQLIAMAKTYPDEMVEVIVYPGALMARVGGVGSVFTKMIDDLTPLDFSRVFERMVANDCDVVEIPGPFDSAVSRTVLVLSDQADKIAEVRVDAGKLYVEASSDKGEAYDVMDTKAEDCEAFSVDPTLILRALKVTTHMAPMRKALAMVAKGGRFMHLIAHCS